MSARSRVGLGAVATAVLAVLPSASSAQEPAPRPNVLVILTDDQRAGGGTFGVMPELRARLLGQGTEYRMAFGPTPLCCPARATLLTGRYAHNHGVKKNGDAQALDQSTVTASAKRESS